MIFKELISSVPWDDIEKVLKEHYPEDYEAAGHGEGFRRVFEELLLLDPTESEYKIFLGISDDGIDVLAYNPNDGELYGLDLTDWAEWLGMEIHEDTSKKFSFEEIIAHSLWEMTFYGWNRDVILGKIEDLKWKKKGICRHCQTPYKEWKEECCFSDVCKKEKLACFCEDGYITIFGCPKCDKDDDL